MKLAVVGHVEWVEFARVERVPARGEIVTATETWAEAAGGGAVAAAELARLAGACTFFTALGDDEVGRRCEAELTALGLRVEAVFQEQPQRRGFVFVDAAGERTITVFGPRLDPRGVDPLPWDELTGYDGVYLTAGDVAAVRAARAARVLVSTARFLATLREADVVLDALVASAQDPSELYRAGVLAPPPRLVVRTAGAAGGVYEPGPRTWRAAELPGPLVDAYGAGDSFAAGLTFGLAAGQPPDEALATAARSGARALTRRGAHGERGLRSGE